MSFSRAAGVKRTLRKNEYFLDLQKKILQYSLKFLWKKPWITLSLWSQIINRKKNRLFKWRQKVSLLLLQAIMKWKTGEVIRSIPALCSKRMKFSFQLFPVGVATTCLYLVSSSATANLCMSSALHPWITFVVFLFSSWLAAPSSVSFLQHVHSPSSAHFNIHVVSKPLHSELSLRMHSFSFFQSLLHLLRDLLSFG